jgi:hypothetical protein
MLGGGQRKKYEAIYTKLRSRTVHSGALHGSERSSAQEDMPGMIRAAFSRGGLRLEEVADCMMMSARLLERAVKGELPEATVSAGESR